MSAWSTTEHSECHDGGEVCKARGRVQAAVGGGAWRLPQQHTQEELQGAGVIFVKSSSHGKIKIAQTETENQEVLGGILSLCSNGNRWCVNIALACIIYSMMGNTMGNSSKISTCCLGEVNNASPS